MSRKPRVQYEGAFYHVITRGNQQQKVFLEDEDFRQYIHRLKSYQKRYDFTLYAYVCWWRSKGAKSGGGGSLQNGFWTHHSPDDSL